MPSPAAASTIVGSPSRRHNLNINLTLTRLPPRSVRDVYCHLDI